MNAEDNKELLDWLDNMSIISQGPKTRLLFAEAGNRIREAQAYQATIIAKHSQPYASAGDRFEMHTKAVAEFLNELYSIMVDPLADGQMEVSEIRAALLAAANRDREMRQSTGAGESERENLILRTMCAVSETGLKSLYYDDGELQDNSCQPFIDWKRDSIDEIQAKLTQRNLASLTSRVASTASPSP